MGLLYVQDCHRKTDNYGLNLVKNKQKSKESG